MKKTGVLIFLFVITLNFISYGQEKGRVENPIEQHDLLSKDTTLVIQGNRIWIRDYPKTGEVVFTLNEGEVCRILEKGEEQIIRGNRDFWYKIEHHDQVGWVFGSQTSIRQNTNFKSFEPFLKYFLQTSFYGKRIDSQKKNVKQFIHEDIGFYRFYNPGAACTLYSSYLSHNNKIAPKIDNPKFFSQRTFQDGFCEESPDPDGIYYKKIESLPDYPDLSVNYEMKKIDIPEKYKNGLKVKVNVLVDKWIIKTMYFMIADNKWNLVLVDDCDCSA
ncbi:MULTISPECIES: SH3 domain-containing protein [Aquimarina]|uniref:SH3 domain-containing protein n=1 Tax=Aquimarina TaxID=290174 RepID=UPI000D68F73E|nr:MULTISPECIES: SH3 domain-containing protein [Aquimarina]